MQKVYLEFERIQRQNLKHAKNIKAATEISNRYNAALKKDLPLIQNVGMQLEHLSELYSGASHSKADIQLLDLFAHTVVRRPVVQVYYINTLPECRTEYKSPNLLSNCSSYLFNPPIPDVSKYDYHVASGMCEFPKVQFPLNGPLNYVFQAMDDKELRHRIKTKTASDADVCRFAHARMVLELSGYGRITDVVTAVISGLMVKEKKAQKDYLADSIGDLERLPDRRFGWETIAGQHLRYIFSNMIVPPFTERDGKFLVHDVTSTMSTDITLVCYTLLNILNHELSGVLTPRDATAAVQNLAEAMITGPTFHDYYLNNKGGARGPFKILLNEARYLTFTTTDKEGVPLGVARSVVSGDYIHGGEEARKKLYAMGDVPKSLRPWWNRTISMFKGLQKTEGIAVPEAVFDRNTQLLRKWHMAIHAISNNSLYLRTSLVLAYEKGIKPRLHTLFGPPNVLSSFTSSDGVECVLDVNYKDSIPDGSAQRIADRIREKYVKQWKEGLEKNDPEVLFANSMTNRSGGVKVEDTTIPTKLQSISNTRLINFLLMLSDYYDLVQFVKALCAPAACTYRYQIDRRARIIYMVPNARQLVGSLIYNANNFIKKSIPTIAQGKQRGNILDAGIQMRATSNPRSLKNSSDVSGMDASTLPDVAEMQARILAMEAKSWKIDRYFSYHSGDYDVTDYRTGKTVTTHLSAISVAIADILARQRPSKFTLKDGFFTREIPVSSDSFESGILNTSEQHTILGDCLHDDIVREWNNEFPDHMVSGEFMVMGDDTLEEIYMSGDDDAYRRYLNYQSERYLGLNYKTEVSASRYYAVFLQQVALCGVMVPQPDRMSPWVDEKSGLAGWDVLARWAVFYEVLMTYGQRTFMPDNLVAIGRSLWNNLRIHNVYTKREVAGFIDESYDGFRITYPYVAISVSPHRCPLFPMYMNTDSMPYEDESGIHPMSTIIKCPGCECTVPAGDGQLSVWNALSHHQHNLDFRPLIPNLPREQYLNKQLPIVLSNLALERYDESFLEWIGFFKSVWLIAYKRDSRLRESRIEEITPFQYERMIKGLKAFYDVGEMAASAVAYSRLVHRRLQFPMALTLMENPKTRIDASLLVRMESKSEMVAVDEHMINYLRKYRPGFSGTSQKWKEKFLLANIMIDVSGPLGVYESQKLEQNLTIPLLPAYGIHSSYGALAKRTSAIGRYFSSSDGVINPWGASFGIRGDVKSTANALNRLWVSSGMDESALQLGMIAVGVPKGERSNLATFVKKLDMLSQRIEYSSYLPNAEFFNVSTKQGALDGGIVDLLRQVTNPLKKGFGERLIRDRFFCSPLVYCNHYLEYRLAGSSLAMLGFRQ